MSSKRASTEAGGSAAKKTRQNDGSAAVAAAEPSAAATTTGASNESNTAVAYIPLESTAMPPVKALQKHSGKYTHSHHGPLPLLRDGSTLKYLAGFSCEMQSEALPGALPVGQNAPQV